MTRPRSDSANGTQRRGVAWTLGSFVVCPCHLPITLSILVAVLGGTAVGAFLRDNLLLAGAVITSVWLLGMARGIWLLRQPNACPVELGGQDVPADARSRQTVLG